MTKPRGNIVLSTFLFPFPVWTRFFYLQRWSEALWLHPRLILYCIVNEDCIFMTISWPFWYSINVQTSKIFFDIKLNIMKSTTSHIILSHVVHWSSNTSYCTHCNHSLVCVMYIIYNTYTLHIFIYFILLRKCMDFFFSIFCVWLKYVKADSSHWLLRGQVEDSPYRFGGLSSLLPERGEQQRFR